jgi:hypothetical protein
MTHAINTVFIDAILVPLLRELGLPETLPLAKLSPRMQKWVLCEATCLQRDAMSHSTFVLLVEYGDPLTRESYLNVNNVEEDDLDAEQESELPWTAVAACRQSRSRTSPTRPAPRSSTPETDQSTASGPRRGPSSTVRPR